MDGYSVWDEASRDYDAETRLVAQANFRVASGGVMQFLALAESSDEFDGRLMLAASQVRALADDSGLSLDEVTSSLRNRWQMIHEANVLQKAREVAEKVRGKAGEAAEAVGDAVGEAASAASNKAGEIASAVGEAASGAGENVVDTAKTFKESMDPEKEELSEAIINGIKRTPRFVPDPIGATVKTVSEIAPPILRGIKKTIKQKRKKTGSAEGQCQNAGCEENAGIGGSYCDRCSMLTNASRKTAAEDHHINEAMYHLIEDHDNGPGDILSQVHADATYRARHGGHTDVGELLKEKHENEHASNIDHSHSSDEEDNPILQTGFDDDYKDTTASRRTAAGNVRKRNGMWVIIDKKSGNVLSSHQTRDEAVAASKRLHSDYKSLKVSSQSSSRLNFNKTAGADDCSEDHAISETYGDEVTEPQLAMYKKYNVSPFDHQELTDFFGVHAHTHIMNHVHQNTPNGYYNPGWGWQRTHRLSSFDPQIENDMG